MKVKVNICEFKSDNPKLLPYPHTCETGDAHKRQDDDTGLCAGQTQKLRNNNSIDVRLAQRRGDRETSD